MNAKRLLLPFYFGSLTEEDRLRVERELLTDTETLVDYLDLKRSFESSALAIFSPSPSLWQRLKPKTARQKRMYISLAVGSALAATLAAILLFKSQPQISEDLRPPMTEILFDSSSELPASTVVL